MNTHQATEPFGVPDRTKETTQSKKEFPATGYRVTEWGESNNEYSCCQTFTGGKIES